MIYYNRDSKVKKLRGGSSTGPVDPPSDGEEIKPKSRRRQVRIFAEAPPEYDGQGNPNGVDSTFIKVGRNIRDFYKRRGDSTDVRVIPTYADKVYDASVYRDNVGDLERGDDIMILGHSGRTLGGVSNRKIAEALNSSKAENCYLGTCYGDKIKGDFDGLKGKNIHYRPYRPWHGFNKYAKTFDEGMWGRNYNDGKDKVVVSPLDEGFTHNVIRDGEVKYNASDDYDALKEHVGSDYQVSDMIDTGEYAGDSSAGSGVIKYEGGDGSSARMDSRVQVPIVRAIYNLFNSTEY